MKHLSRADEKLGFDPKRGKQAERRAAQRQSRKPILSPRPCIHNSRPFICHRNFTKPRLRANMA